MPPSRSWMGVITPQKLSQPDHASLAIFKHFIVPEPDHPVAFGLDDCRSGCIVFLGMLPTVDFDHQVGPMAGEIGDVMADWNLPAPPRLGVKFAQ